MDELKKMMEGLRESQILLEESLTILETAKEDLEEIENRYPILKKWKSFSFLSYLSSFQFL